MGPLRLKRRQCHSLKPRVWSRTTGEIKWQLDNQRPIALVVFGHLNPFLEIGVSDDNSDLIYRVAVPFEGKDVCDLLPFELYTIALSALFGDLCDPAFIALDTKRCRASLQLKVRGWRTLE